MTPDDFRWTDLFHARGSRRDFLRAGGSAAALVALGGCATARRGDAGPRFRADPFGLGVASGDPLPDGVVLWTRLGREALEGAVAGDSPVPVRWEVAHDPAFARVARAGEALALPELGHSVHAEVGGLEPGRVYHYRFTAGGAESATGRTRTAPAAGTPTQRLRLGFVSCQNWEHGLYTAYEHLAREDLDLLVHLGDYIYEARFDSAPIVREHTGEEPVTLEGYRRRYALYRGDPALQAAHAAFPWVVTQDDHEVDNNWAGVHPQDGQSRGAFLLRRAAAFQAYYEFMPLRRASMPAGPDARLWRRLAFGDLVEMSVLDTRVARDDQPCGDGNAPRCPENLRPDIQILGAEQERWLFRGLADARARWNVLANQVLVAQLARPTDDGGVTYSMDKWDGYPAARRRLLEHVATVRPSNPVVLTGDIHSNWVADLKRDFDDPRSEVLGTELVGTSISSGGDGQDTYGGFEGTQAANPHVRWYNGRRGYVRCEVTPATWRADYRTVPYVSRPGAPVDTAATWVVEDGRPGAQRG